MGSSKNVLYDLLFEINKHLDRLSDWEKNFIKDMVRITDSGKRISPKQFKKIRVIHTYKI